VSTLWGRISTSGGALVVGGLLIWAMAWAIDFYGHLTGGAPVDASGHGGDALVRVNFPLSGFPLIVLGGVLLLGGDRLLERGNTPRFAAGMLIALDGLAHAFAFNDHLGEPLWAALFAVIAPAQIALGLALPYLDRSLDRWWVLGIMGLLVGYAVTRVVSVPALGFPEPVEALGVFSKSTEAVALAVLGPRAMGAGASRRNPAAAEAGAPTGAK